MQNKFEDEIQKQLDDFTLTPSNKIWGKIEANLDSNEHRKFPIWWFSVAGTIILGAGFWYYNTLSNTKNADNTVKITNKAMRINQNNKPTNTIIIATEEHTTYKLIKNVGATLIAKPTSNNKRVFSQPNKTASTNNSPNTSNKLNAATKINSPIDDFKIKSIKEDYTANSNPSLLNPSKQNAIVAKIQSVNKYEDLPKDSIQTNESSTSVASKDSIFKKEAVVINIKHKEDSITAYNKKGKFMITIGSGLINILSKSPVYSDALSSAADPNNNPAMSTNERTTSSPTKGFSIKAGLVYQQPLALKWQLLVGLNYLYIQNTQSVGLRKDSINLSDDGHYFEAGYQSNLINYAHIVQAPLQLKYLLNSHSKHPFYLLFGGNVGYQLNSKWLVGANSNTILYYKKTLATNFVASTMLGFGIAINDLSIDITGHQSITPLQNSNYSKKYLQQLSLDVNIPLNFFSFNKQKK